jgi:anti-sigma-K factor RskA
MDNKEIIASGILETYVLGIASVQENQEIDKLRKENVEIENEIQEIQNALEQYAFSHEQSPPAALKPKVMDALDGLNGDENVRSLNSNIKKSIFPQWVAAASVAFLLLSIGANWLLYKNLKKSEDKYEALASENQQMAYDNNVLKTSYNQEVGLLQNSKIQMVTLKGSGKTNNSKVMLYWDMKTMDVYLSAMNLPSAPKGKKYYLWVFVNGMPKNAGLVDMSMKMCKMLPCLHGQGFAISLEEENGIIETPKGEIYVQGVV